MGNVRGITKNVPSLQVYEHTLPHNSIYQVSHCSALLIGCVKFCSCLYIHILHYYYHPSHFLLKPTTVLEIGKNCIRSQTVNVIHTLQEILCNLHIQITWYANYSYCVNVVTFDMIHYTRLSEIHHTVFVIPQIPFVNVYNDGRIQVISVPFPIS